ncbi:putative quinol monooxygenase [Mycobacteroides franklinii]|uniref:putative quinol monooxygenase n=2 Tax=Mycobacteriaceae TaxID=1762 RepID=UPI000D6A1098|nr:antibiotic biosynthesis monooxygenase [Mycobacteroides franklinii]MDM2217737.1 antibiotic biosynthesis monooxygenase [Mycobacteroides abscessus]MDM2232573.1 antibiotic biosynthesis monooxygenase [Mycobacteroides abscessus]
MSGQQVPGEPAQAAPAWILPAARVLTPRPSSSSPVHVVGEVTAKLGAEEAIWGHLNILLEHTRRDRGNLRYEILRDAGDPGHFLVHQTWKTPQRLHKYLQSEPVIRRIHAIQQAAQIPLQLTVCDVQRVHAKPAPAPTGGVTVHRSSGAPSQPVPAPRSSGAMIDRFEVKP